MVRVMPGEDSDDPVSWKRLLRGEQSQNAGVRRGFLKQLLDQIDITVGAAESLDKVIATTTTSIDWRRVIVENPNLIEYCGKRQIRYYSDNNVYLLKGVRRSGEHVDLFSYQLYLGELSEKHATGDLAPFGEPRYCPVHTDSDEPSIRLVCDDGEDQIHMQIWNMDSTFRIQLWSSAGKLPAGLKKSCEEQPDFEFDGDGDLCLNVEVKETEENIDRVVETVREYVAE